MKTVLFVCVHNAGRSKMAEAFLNYLAAENKMKVRAISAGTRPGEAVNPVVARAMDEIGLPLHASRPRQLTTSLLADADRIITMGCGVDATDCPAGFLTSEDWNLDDPAGMEIEGVRRIRDQISKRVVKLLHAYATNKTG